MAVNEQIRTEAETIDKVTSQVQVYALPAYLGANVAGVLITSAQIAICHIPVCTPQLFERLEPNKPSVARESPRV